MKVGDVAYCCDRGTEMLLLCGGNTPETQRTEALSWYLVIKDRLIRPAELPPEVAAQYGGAEEVEVTKMIGVSFCPFCGADLEPMKWG